MRIDAVTIFPDYLDALNLSLIGRARRDGLIDLRVHDLRDFTHDRHRTVDDTPYGGGAGMVMKPQPWSEALTHVLDSADLPAHWARLDDFEGEGYARIPLSVHTPDGQVEAFIYRHHEDGSQQTES